MTFVRNARVMLIGFALAQALPLIASPLLTRLYSPEAFGLQTLFVSATSVVLVAATLRLDLAAVLASDRRQAMQIIALGLSQAAVVTLLALAVAALAAQPIALALGHPQQAWVWAVPAMILVLGIVQLASGLMSWLKRFGPVSRAQVINQVGYLGIAIALGLVSAPVEGLVFAKLAGQALAAIALIWLLREFLPEIHLPPAAARAELWQRCRPFLLFNTPYSLVGVLGREVPVFAFSFVSATAAAGFYGLARTLLWAPATLLASSLSQVFYREAAEHRGTLRLERLTFAMLGATTTATAPIFASLMVWGDVAFAQIFGAEWAAAGSYAMVLSFPAWLAIQTSWPERLFESMGRQSLSFAIQIGFDTLSAVFVFGSALTRQPAFTTVIVFAAVNSLFHLTYLTGMIRVAKFTIRSLIGAIGKGAAVFALCAGAFAAARLSSSELVPALYASIAIAAAVSAVIGLLSYKSVQSLGAD